MLFYLRQDMSNQIMLAEIGSYRYLREIWYQRTGVIWESRPL